MNSASRAEKLVEVFGYIRCGQLSRICLLADDVQEPYCLLRRCPYLLGRAVLRRVVNEVKQLGGHPTSGATFPRSPLLKRSVAVSFGFAFERLCAWVCVATCQHCRSLKQPAQLLPIL